MFQKALYPDDINDAYAMLLKQAESLIYDDDDLYSSLANISALLNTFFDQINWVGFYIAKSGQLVLGPFQGLPACNRIDFGRGVCGFVAKHQETALVADVHQFEGHIACDSASNSEIVVPIFDLYGNFVGVLDIDSPQFNRFNETDKINLEKLCLLLSPKFSL